MTAAKVATLSEFLLARIAEDEEAARAAAEHPVPADADAVYVRWVRHDTGWVMAAGGEWVEGSALFARHDPARVLAECEAKRRIVEAHGLWMHASGAWTCDAGEEWTGGDVFDLDEPGGACPTLRLLALPYADHQDFREEWRP